MEEKRLKICVYAIAKNEEKFCERWYNSMKEADYVVVLDTGSSDNTASKLKELGAYVERFIFVPFRFDIARNKALSICPIDTDIFVSTDLDEVFEPGWANILRDNWNPAKHKRCIYKYSWSHLENGSPGRTFQYDKIHSIDWNWIYPVHETLFHKINKNTYYNDEMVLNLFDKIHLHHYPDKTKSRANYLDLLENRKRNFPNDHYGLIYLAHEYYYREKYDQCICEIDNIFKKFESNLTDIEKASLYLFKADSYLAKESKTFAIKNYLYSISESLTYREPYIGLAKLYLKYKEYGNAIDIMKIGLRVSKRHYTWFERDTSWNYEPYDILAISSYYNGNKKESLSYAIKAYSFDGKNDRLFNNINRIMSNISPDEFIN